MTLRLWIETTYQPAYRAGGWAWVRAEGAVVSGAAGGARGLEGPALSARALLAGTADLPAGVALALHLSDPVLVAGLRSLAGWRAANWLDPEGAPVADAQAWREIAGRLAGRPLSLVRGDPGAARTPAAFAAAWAELARDKAKAQGDFANAIPRPNLSKVPGL